jgi:hypothetical protein
MAAVAAVLFATACGGGGGSSSGTTASTDTTTTSGAGGTGGGGSGGTTGGGTGGSTGGGTTTGGANAVVAGAVSTPYPTIENLAVEWAYTGDANANSVVNVRYRKSGDTAWRNGMALRNVPAGSTEGFSWSNRHSGSIFDLQPATTYEIELTLTDPDGGGETRTTTATTRAIPTPMAGAPVRNATPATLASVLSSAQPGDRIVLGAGSYSGFQINASGQAGKPIVISGQPGASISGEIGIFSRSHIYLENLTLTGRIRFNGSNNISIVRSTIQAATAQGGDGIVTYTRAENAYIADNVVTGTTVWADSSLGVNGNNLGEGILVTGPGHVIMNNRVSNFRDGISLLEESEGVDQISIDILNNDIRQNADDGVEADFCKHNCRIMRNRLTDNFIALSSQPGLGGPTYFIRNVAYNVAHVAFKLYRTSYGDVLLHNTVVKSGDGFGVYAGVPVHRAYIANNLFIGGPGGTYGGYSNGSGRVIDFTYLNTADSSIDYQAYGTTASTFSGKIGTYSFSNVSQLNANTPEKHSVQTDLSAFVGAVAYPATPMTIHAPVDLRIQSGTAPVDKALPIANINDGYAGMAPDIGAYEAGATLPVYGPR